jgi:hypothetical protein
MVTTSVVDVVTVASAATDVALAALAAAIAILQATAAASRERIMGSVIAADTPAGPTVGAASPLATAATDGAPAGSATGATIAATCHHPPAGLPFFATHVSTPTDPGVSAAGPLAAVDAVGTLVDTTTSVITGHSSTGILIFIAGASTLAGPV